MNCCSVAFQAGLESVKVYVKTDFSCCIFKDETNKTTNDVLDKSTACTYPSSYRFCIRAILLCKP